MSVTEVEPVTKQYLYEGMFLVDSGKFATDSEAVVEAIMAVLKRAGATVVAHRPWQDGKLAYEIDGMKKGLHYIVCFTMPGKGMTVLNRQCKLSDTIVRHIVIRQMQSVFDATVAAISGTSPVESADDGAEAAPADSETESDV